MAKCKRSPEGIILVVAGVTIYYNHVLFYREALKRLYHLLRTTLCV